MKEVRFFPVTMILAAIGITLLISQESSPGAISLGPEVTAWLKNQTNIQTWSADFVQTRSLKSLTKPLVSKGHLWFKAPNSFRWELGKPAQTIALRAPDAMFIIYPRFKRVEKLSLVGAQSSQWKDVLALLEAGFPRSAEEIESRYQIVSQKVSEGIGKLVLQPKSSTARKMISQITLEFEVAKSTLSATELEFGDGSTMRNEFSQQENNIPVDPALFAPDIPPDFTVVNLNK